MLVLKVWKNQPGKYFCISSKSRTGKWEDKFFKKTQFDQVKDYLDDNLDKDLYWCPHGFTHPRRLKDYAELPRLLWADLDEANPKKITPMPSIAWQSSPGRYVALWNIKSTIDEEVNRRLTYHVGADPGGWDLTQVLRIPNTRNFKYPSGPTVKMLWDDGPLYDMSEIIHALPELQTVEVPGSDVLKIYRQYEKRLSLFARKSLMGGGKVSVGKRSEVLWKLNQELLEAGASIDDAFLLLKNSPWNKFLKRRDGDAQLRRELDKGVKKKLESAPVAKIKEAERPDIEFLSTSIADVQEEKLDWIWYPYIALGELTIIEGDPGLGKSYLAQMIGLHIVDGKKLPTVKMGYRPRAGKVAYFDLENTASTVTKRRLMDNNCCNPALYFQEERPFMMDDQETLENVCLAIEKIKPLLVVFDTLNTYVGKGDMHKGSEAQQALVPFREIAKRYNCAVIVIRHLTKSTKEKALYRGQGSMSIGGLARVIITVGQDPDNEDVRVMAVSKINVTKKPKALTFTIESLPDTLKYQDRSKFMWGDFVELNADEILVTANNHNGNHKATTKKNEETGFELLTNFLKDGKISDTSIRAMLAPRGFTDGDITKLLLEHTVKIRSKKTGQVYYRLKDSSSDE